MRPAIGLDRWLLPEGIEEALPREARRLEQMRREVLDLFYRWGYDLVIPPLIEYLESLLTGTGSDLDLQTFKLTDQLTGRLMGVRADMTPQVARIEAHRLRHEHPVRLCYVGTVLHTRPDAPGGTRSPLQMGAELYGHAGIESDLEVLRLMLEALALTGLREVYLDLGQVEIFRGLARQAGLSADREAALFDALQRKSRPEIEALLSDLPVASDLAQMLLAITDLNGAEDVLEQAQRVLGSAHDDVHQALADLQAIVPIAYVVCYLLHRYTLTSPSYAATVIIPASCSRPMCPAAGRRWLRADAMTTSGMCLVAPDLPPASAATSGPWLACSPSCRPNLRGSWPRCGRPSAAGAGRESSSAGRTRDIRTSRAAGEYPRHGLRS